MLRSVVSPPNIPKGPRKHRCEAPFTVSTNCPLRNPKYHQIETIRPLIEVHWGCRYQVPSISFGESYRSLVAFEDEAWAPGLRAFNSPWQLILTAVVEPRILSEGKQKQPGFLESPPAVDTWRLSGNSCCLTQRQN